MTDVIRWTPEDMIAATIEHWGSDGIEAEDCEVIMDDRGDEPCLVVVHTPSGRTSDEAGDAGRWTPGGLTWGDRPPDLSRRLQRLLDDRGLSISEAARMAGVEKQRAWLVVTGRNDNPTWKTVTRLVEGVGGTLAELFADDG